MDNVKLTQIIQGLNTAFINQNIASDISYRPQFISNDYKEGKKVIASIEEELLTCDEFTISVAFITMGGITPLLQTLKELENRGVQGKILTTDYLMFSEPKALKLLSEFENIQLKMYVTRGTKEGFHTKGYIFKKGDVYKIIVGSSNMTLSALTTNREWNTKIVSTTEGEYSQSIEAEFAQLWNSQNALTYQQFIDDYTLLYTNIKMIENQKMVAIRAKEASVEAYSLKPNSMQVSFINNLKKMYDEGEEKA